MIKKFIYLFISYDSYNININDEIITEMIKYNCDLDLINYLI